MAAPAPETRDLNSLRGAGLIVLISAAVHVVPGVSGHSDLFVVAAVLAAIGAGLLLGLRWLAWPGFFVVLAALVFAAGGVADPAMRPDWAFAGILILDGLAALTLFLNLWRR